MTSLTARLRSIPARWSLPVVAVALVAVTAALPESAPAPVDGGRRDVAVRESSWVCPTQSGWTVAAGQVRAGREAAAVTLPGATPLAGDWPDASRWRTGAADTGSALAMVQRGDGSGAVGWAAGTGTKAQGGGAVLAACPGVVDDAWFVGLDPARAGSSITVANPGETRAVVDLSWWGTAGAVESLDTTGIVVEAGQVKTVSVASVAAGEGLVAVKVSRRWGVVTAWATDAGAGGEGTAVVSPASSTGRDQVLAGLPDTGTTRLVVANPGTTTAHVAVEVLGPRGSFAAQGLDDVVVEPESTRVVAVPASVDVRSASLRLTSDVPVVGAALVATGDDVAHVVAAPRLTGPAVVPVRLAGRWTRLALTATAATEVRVEAFDAAMASLGQQAVAVGAGATTTVDLAAASTRSAAYVVVEPADADGIHAGAWVRDGSQLAAAVVRPAPVTVTAPGVSVR